jgi:hypothetical protein
MVEMVEARRNADKVEQRHDLFSGLLDAAEEEQGGEAALSDEELIGRFSGSQSFGIPGKRPTFFLGNMFIFLLAGHEVRSSPSRRVALKAKIAPYRPQRIHCASHLPC